MSMDGDACALRKKLRAPLALLVLALSFSAGCSDAEAPGAAKSSSSSDEQAVLATTQEAEDADLVKEGWKTYRQTCSACHNLDPALDGPLGPAIAGSSRELLEARVLRGEYPPGYTPKRNTKAMVPLPHLEGKIGALFAYLNQ